MEGIIESHLLLSSPNRQHCRVPKIQGQQQNQGYEREAGGKTNQLEEGTLSANEAKGSWTTSPSNRPPWAVPMVAQTLIILVVYGDGYQVARSNDANCACVLRSTLDSDLPRAPSNAQFSTSNHNIAFFCFKFGLIESRTDSDSSLTFRDRKHNLSDFLRSILP